MDAYRNNVALSRNQCCSGNAAVDFVPPAHIVINGTIFGRNLLKAKCVFIFSQQFLPKTVLILSILIGTNVYRPSCKVLVMLGHIFNQT